jgi:hypothetical protein
MPKLRQFARLMMRGRASLHTDETWSDLAKESNHLFAAKWPDEDNLVLLVDAMDLEGIPGQIYTNCVNLHVGASFECSALQ